MNEINQSFSINTIIEIIQSIPVKHLHKIQDFVLNLKEDTEKKNITIHLPDSLMNSKPIKLGKRDWTRDDLYEERMKKYDE